MNRLLLQTFTDPDGVSQAAAREFVRCANDAIAAGRRFTVALSGGSTPKKMYDVLASAAYRDKVDWSKVDLFWGDERAVAPDHPDANYKTAHEGLLTKLPIPEYCIHRMQAEKPDHASAAADYQKEIARVFGVNVDGMPPAFDLILLGMGPDGHTASLFPGNPALKETTRWVISVANSPKPPPDRLTLTKPLINRAREVLFLVTGADKSDRVFEIFTGPSNAERLPSQSIRPTTGQLVWYLDAAAAARLTAGIAGAT